jgi:hypothetical protein
MSIFLRLDSDVELYNIVFMLAWLSEGYVKQRTARHLLLQDWAQEGDAQ